jgi:hypothetical protein
MDRAAGWGFPSVWIDPSFPRGRIEWTEDGGIILSIADWIALMARIRAADPELEPHLRATHRDWK